MTSTSGTSGRRTIGGRGRGSGEDTHSQEELNCKVRPRVLQARARLQGDQKRQSEERKGRREKREGQEGKERREGGKGRSGTGLDRAPTSALALLCPGTGSCIGRLIRIAFTRPLKRMSSNLSGIG